MCGVLLVLLMFCCRYSAEEIHFNLMAIVSDRLQQYQNSINEIHKQIEVSQLLPVSSGHS